MPERVFNVLFLCTGNSARSIMAECALNRFARGTMRAFSAGSHPSGTIHPMTLELLAELGFDTTSLRSKSWDEFARPGSPDLDFVFTVCDNAAGEICPVWPGQPITAHWGVRDPVAFTGPDDTKRREFRRIFLELETRVRLFASLPIASLDRMTLERRVAEIGKVRGDGGKT